MRNEIANLSVMCQNKMTGCEWMGLFKEYNVSVHHWYFSRGSRVSEHHFLHICAYCFVFETVPNFHDDET